jgi:hypothetical protein
LQAIFFQNKVSINNKIQKSKFFIFFIYNISLTLTVCNNHQQRQIWKHDFLLVGFISRPEAQQSIKDLERDLAATRESRERKLIRWDQVVQRLWQKSNLMQIWCSQSSNTLHSETFGGVVNVAQQKNDIACLKEFTSENSNQKVCHRFLRTSILENYKEKQ